MGIRIHKKIGYGVLDIKTIDGKVDDPRFDYEKYTDNDEGRYDLKKYLKYLKSNEQRILEIANNEWFNYGPDLTFMIDDLEKALKKSFYFTSPITYEAEFGLENVLLVQRPGDESWSRYDNIIDYYENSHDPKVKVLNGNGIYPYDYGKKRLRPPSECAISEAIIKAKVSRDFFDGNELKRLGGHVERMFAGTKMEDHYKNDWRPIIPIDILAYIDFLDCFNDPFGENGIVNSLRPMIYSYWS